MEDRVLTVNAYTDVEVEPTTESLPVEASDEKLSGPVFAAADFDYVDYIWVPGARNTSWW